MEVQETIDDNNDNSEEFESIFKTPYAVSVTDERRIIHEGGSYEVLFFDRNDKLVGFTEWISLDTAERVVDKISAHKKEIRAAVHGRKYNAEPAFLIIGVYETQNQDKFKHKVETAPAFECVFIHTP